MVIWGSEVCPDYFGEYPPPRATPYGQVVQVRRAKPGVCFVESGGTWLLALACSRYECLERAALELELDITGLEDLKAVIWARHPEYARVSNVPLRALLAAQPPDTPEARWLRRGLIQPPSVPVETFWADEALREAERRLFAEGGAYDGA